MAIASVAALGLPALPASADSSTNVVNATARTTLTATSGTLPDGPVGRIVYSADTVNYGNFHYLYTMAPDGTGIQRLTPAVCQPCSDHATDTAPEWSPEGSRVVFQSNRDNLSSAVHIYTIGADGRGMRRLTSKGSNFAPTWAPTGASIAFESNRTGDNEIFVMAADGTSQVNVSQHAGLDRSPTWAPDGEQLAFLSNRDGDLDVYVVNDDGTGLVNVSDNTVADASPAWAPDGSMIAFSSLNDDRDISVATPDGTVVSPIAQEVGVHETVPIWSPDSSQIAYRKDQLNPALAVMDANGSNSQEIAPWWADDPEGVSATWSPNGDRIAYGDGTAISAVDIDASDQSTLLFESGDAFRFPDWQTLTATMQASPAAIAFGQSVTLTAHLHWYETTSNLDLSVYRRPVGGPASLVTSGAVDVSGDLVVQVEPTKTTSYYATWSGDGDHDGITGGSISVGVHVLVRARVSGFYGTSGSWRLFHLGRPIRQRGTVVPDHSGKRLVFEAQVRRDGAWRDFARSSFLIRADGSASAILTPSRRGNYRVRNIFKGDADHLGGTSRWILVRVTA